jgi:hypothetical protein
MADNSRSVDTTASPEKAWATWSDTSTWPTWNPDVEDVTLDRGIAEGSTGTMTTKAGGTHHIAISDVQPHRGFTLTSDLPMPAVKAQFRCAIEPTVSGSRISQAVTIKGALAPLMGGMITGRIVPTFDALLQGLRAHVESAS